MAFLQKIYKLRSRTCSNLVRRAYSDDVETTGSYKRKGLVLGVYEMSTGDTKEYDFTRSATSFNKQAGGRLYDLLRDSGGKLRKGKAEVYHNLDPEYYSVALAGVGKPDAGLDYNEQLDEARENARIAAGVGALALRRSGVDYIMLDSFNGQEEAAAEGATLAVYRYQDYKAKEDRKIVPKIDIVGEADRTAWMRGVNKGEAQNLARRLSDAPANLMTPTLFAQAAVEELCPCGVTVEIRDKEWIESKKMTAFLAAARGSCEQPLFLELGYCGGGPDEKPIVLIGKGVTFDSGGLCLRKCKGMMEYKADMAGAASVVGTMKAVAKLNLPLNVVGVIPLCENMPSGLAAKPGDLVRCMKGTTVITNSTANFSTLILADALTYSTANYKPKLVIDIATVPGVTDGMRTAVGEAATGVFCTNDNLYNEMTKAGAYTGDRIWRFPLWKTYSRKVARTRSADLINYGIGPGGDPCLAAAFLREFIPCGDWIHMDITGSGMYHYRADVPYLATGQMTGRPTRFLINLLVLLVNSIAIGVPTIKPPPLPTR